MASLLGFMGVVCVVRPPFLMDALAGVTLDVKDPVFDGDRHMDATPAVEVSGDRWATMGIVLVSSVVASCAYLCVRVVGTRVHYMTLVMSFGVMSCLLSPLVSLLLIATERGDAPSSSSSHASSLSSSWRLPRSLADVALHVGVGATALIGQILLNRALQLASAGRVLLVRNLDVLFAFLYDVTLLGHSLHPWSLAGACMILCATGLMTASRSKMAKNDE